MLSPERIKYLRLLFLKLKKKNVIILDISGQNPKINITYFFSPKISKHRFKYNNVMKVIIKKRNNEENTTQKEMVPRL